MNTRPRIIRAPPPAPPPTPNASGFFEPGEPRLPRSFWRDVLNELEQVRWLKARDVAARTAVTVGLLALLMLFTLLCDSLTRAILGT